MAEWLYRAAMLVVAVMLFVAVARVAAEPERAPKRLIRAEALCVGSGFVFWFTLATPSARWATLIELFLWCAMAGPCLALWVMSTPPRTQRGDTYSSNQPTPDAQQRSKQLRARYASRTGRE